MTAVDRDELKRLAEGATPGPWEWDEVMNPFYNDPDGQSCGGDGTGMVEFFQTDADGETLFDEEGEVRGVLPWKFNNADFIAAANPATALSLLDALAAAEARCDFIRKVQRDVVRAEIEQEGLVDDGWRDRALAAERDRDALQARLDEAKGERITTAAIRHSSGVIVTVERPDRHGDCINFLNRCGLEYKEVLGFLTSTGRFVDRREAGRIAEANGQGKTRPNCNGLFSEDLWDEPFASKETNNG